MISAYFELVVRNVNVLNIFVGYCVACEVLEMNFDKVVNRFSIFFVLFSQYRTKYFVYIKISQKKFTKIKLGWKGTNWVLLF